MPRLAVALRQLLEGFGLGAHRLVLDMSGGVEVWLARDDTVVIGAGALGSYGPAELAFALALAQALGSQGHLLRLAGDLAALPTAAVRAFDAYPASLAAARVLAQLDSRVRGGDPLGSSPRPFSGTTRPSGSSRSAPWSDSPHEPSRARAAHRDLRDDSRRGLRHGQAATLGCRSSRFTPGNASMGTYGFRAERLELACALAEVTEESAEFEFEATFSETAETSEAWVTMNSGLSTAPPPGSWDGQYFRSTAEAPRVFPSQCSDCQMALEETIAVALLSRSQSEASGNQCPEAPLDGGLPAEDAGALPPRQRPLGFDGVRACGELWTSVCGALKGRRRGLRGGMQRLPG